MQRHRVCAVVGVPVFSLLSVVSVLGQGAQQPQIGIETSYPRHVARGQTTVVNVAILNRDAVQAAEISPSTGTLDVAKDAAPGDRSLVLVLPMGRTVPIPISIPTHAPAISDLRIVPPQSNQPTLELQLAAADAAGDLGDAPYVWFTAGCGSEPLVGAVRGKVSAGVVRAALPNLRKVAVGGIPAAGRCDLQVRVTDSTGIDSNTLKTTVEFRN